MLACLVHYPTSIEVMISVVRKEVLWIAKSPSAAASWINIHVLAFKPATNVAAVAVGSEFFFIKPKCGSCSCYSHKQSLQSMRNISWNSTIHDILEFLQNTNSFYMLNAYPYDYFVRSNGIFPILYALFKPLPEVEQIVDMNTLFHNESMLDAMMDATYYSIAASNFSVIRIIVNETGWPWSGGANES
ncbi:glucan endo-1,3-beta-glucosidase 4-like protein [Tanacetum coccineum]